MKLLISYKSWKQWTKDEEGRFSDVDHPAPKMYPCYGYMALESWGRQTLRPIYLYQKDIDAMSLELIAVAQRL